MLNINQQPHCICSLLPEIDQRQATDIDTVYNFMAFLQDHLTGQQTQDSNQIHICLPATKFD